MPAPTVGISDAAVTATVSATGATLLTASTAGKTYVKLETKQSATSGKAQASLASVAAGYTASKAAQTSAVSDITVTPSNNTYYIECYDGSCTLS